MVRPLPSQGRNKGSIPFGSTLKIIGDWGNGIPSRFGRESKGSIPLSPAPVWSNGMTALSGGAS